MHKLPIAVAERLAGRLKELRKQKGVSQDMLARASDVSRPTLAKMESGLSSPRLSNLEQLARALDVDVLDLLTHRPVCEQSPEETAPRVRIAKNVNRLRVGLALSQESLSIASDHFRTFIGNLEHQRANPTIRDLVQIAEALGVEVPYLLSPLSDSDATRDMQKMVRRARPASSRSNE